MVSIIICAYTENRWEDLLAAVSSAQNQSPLPDEILVVIDHNPTLFERAKLQLQGVVVLENFHPRGLSGARNSGISVAKGDIIAFMDEDAVAEAGWLENLLESYGDSKVMGVGGAILPLWQGKKPAWFPEEFHWVVGCTYRGLPEDVSAIRNLIGCNMSFRADVFKKVGGFRSGIGRIGTLPFGCEETELCIRANQRLSELKFLYKPQARVSHRVPKTRQSFRYFISRCYAEGISKALITFVIGQQDGLSSEKSYTTRVLPQGVLRGIRDFFVKRDFAGLGRSGAILAGFFFTALGFLVGKFSLTVRPRHFRRLTEEVGLQ